MQDIMSKDEVTIHMNLNGGQCEGKAWGCDLSYDYVKLMHYIQHRRAT